MSVAKIGVAANSGITPPRVEIDSGPTPTMPEATDRIGRSCVVPVRTVEDT
jgi:hypothetical protein